MARMKSVLWILAMVFAGRCCAQNSCSPAAIPASGVRVQTVVAELRRNHVDEMETNISPRIAGQMEKLKEALSVASDAALACEKPLVEPGELQKSLIQTFHANGPFPETSDSLSQDDPRYKEENGSYGHDLRVGVVRPEGVEGLLQIEFSINIECGDDTMLLIFELRDGHWKQRLRWQSPPLKDISDAFGDFFVSTILPGDASSSGSESKWRLVVAHGTPWCTSRFSGFKVDLLAPSSEPRVPKVLWHIARDYSRNAYEPRIKSSGSVFELRLNDDCMSWDSYHCFERRVIYRYQVDGNDHVRRIGPMGVNARGFVHEWLTAPWEESQNLAIVDARTELQKVHQEFVQPAKWDSSKYVDHKYGPVRACTTPGAFQVEIDSSLETEVPGKPGGDSKPLASHYFHVREGKDGYVMVSAPTEPDPACTGPDLTPSPGI
jgi:hypothetical protein